MSKKLAQSMDMNFKVIFKKPRYSKLPSIDKIAENDVTDKAIANGTIHEGNAHAQKDRHPSQSSTKSGKKEFTPPDGGWGWFVLLATHFTLIFREGIAKGLGIFLPIFRTYFGVSTSMIGWVSSFCVTFADFTGIISGPMCRRFGCRPVAMIGGLFGGAGLIIASYSQNITHLSICLSISGVGLGLSLTPSLTMVGRYFDKRYSLANGLSYAGSGVGILILAPIAQILIDTYGWRGALLTMGALCFHVAVCGALLRPIPVWKPPTHSAKDATYKQCNTSDNEDVPDEKGNFGVIESNGRINGVRGPASIVVEEVNGHARIVEESYSGSFEKTTSTEVADLDSIEEYRGRNKQLSEGELKRELPNGSVCEPEGDNIDSDYDAEKEEEDDEEEEESRAQACVRLLGLSLFIDVKFLILMTVQFCGRFTYMGWLIYLVPHAQEKGVEPMQAAFVASVAGISNIIARAGHGLIVDYKILTAAQLLTIASIGSALPMLLDPVLNTYGGLIAGSLAYGLASGVFFPIAVVVIKQSIGMERFPNALGWSYGFGGIGRMSAGFITGWLYDVFGDYDLSFIMLGLIQMFATSLMFIYLCLERRSRMREKAAESCLDEDKS